jgi:hypothetical protein
MHVEPLEKLPRSVREFLSHYAMIVVSILTALALEQVALRLEHRHEGARAKEEIEQEIAANRQAVEASLALTRTNATQWEALLKRTLADIKAGQSSNETRVATLRESAPLFRDASPSLKTTAWEAALSDHSVNYLDHDLLTRYSEIYSSQRVFSQNMWDVVRNTAIGHLSAISRAVALDDADPVATVTVLNERMLVIHNLESQLLQLDAALKGEDPEAAFDAARAPAPASAAASH